MSSDIRLCLPFQFPCRDNSGIAGTLGYSLDLPCLWIPLWKSMIYLYRGDKKKSLLSTYYISVLKNRPFENT